jgi:hypothetical protein
MHRRTRIPEKALKKLEAAVRSKNRRARFIFEVTTGGRWSQV